MSPCQDFPFWNIVEDFLFAVIWAIKQGAPIPMEISSFEDTRQDSRTACNAYEFSI